MARTLHDYVIADGKVDDLHCSVQRGKEAVSARWRVAVNSRACRKYLKLYPLEALQFLGIVPRGRGMLAMGGIGCNVGELCSTRGGETLWP